MTKDRIRELRGELDAERISCGELHEIETAFAAVPDAALWDLRENAMASDMLDVLEVAHTITEAAKPFRPRLDAR